MEDVKQPVVVCGEISREDRLMLSDPVAELSQCLLLSVQLAAGTDEVRNVE